MDLPGLIAARAADMDIESYVQLPPKFSARQLAALGAFGTFSADSIHGTENRCTAICTTTA